MGQCHRQIHLRIAIPALSETSFSTCSWGTRSSIHHLPESKISQSANWPSKILFQLIIGFLSPGFFPKKKSVEDIFCRSRFAGFAAPPLPSVLILVAKLERAPWPCYEFFSYQITGLKLISKQVRFGKIYNFDMNSPFLGQHFGWAGSYKLSKWYDYISIMILYERHEKHERHERLKDHKIMKS